MEEIHEMILDNGKEVKVRYIRGGAKLSAGEWLLELDRLIKLVEERQTVVTCDDLGSIFEECTLVPATSKEPVLTWPSGEPRAVMVDFGGPRAIVPVKSGFGPLHLVGEVVTEP